MKKVKFMALTAMAFVGISSLVIVGCQKKEATSTSKSNIVYQTGEPTGKTRFKAYVVSGGNVFEVETGMYHEGPSITGAMHHWCSTSIVMICHVLKMPGLSASPNNGNWVSNDDFDALELNKSGEMLDFYNNNVHNGSYTVEESFTFRIFDEAANKDIRYTVPAGTYRVVEEGNKYAILFRVKA